MIPFPQLGRADAPEPWGETQVLLRPNAMRMVRRWTHGPVTGFELGRSLWGRPWMTVNAYAVDGLLIDTGQRHMRREAVAAFLTQPFERVLLTHHHEDHSGNAAEVARQRPVPVLGHPDTIAKMRRPFRILPYQQLYWGPTEPVEMTPLPEIIESDRYRFVPIHTPGHSKDLTVFWVKEEGWLFAGDLYLGDRIKYFRVDERVPEQIDSLRRVLTHPFDTLFCAHRPRLTNGAEHLQRKLQYLEDLQGRVLDLHDKGYSEGRVVAGLGLPEAWQIRLLSGGNVSLQNGVRSILRAAR